jgi:hypothetical protein
LNDRVSHQQPEALPRFDPGEALLTPKSRIGKKSCREDGYAFLLSTPTEEVIAAFGSAVKAKRSLSLVSPHQHFFFVASQYGTCEWTIGSGTAGWLTG